MTDEDLANLLGEKPGTTDPGFRFDVFARMARNAQRRAAHRRAVNIFAVSTAIGLFFPLANAAGFSFETIQPLLYAAIAVGGAFLLAQETAIGRRSPFARALAHLRFRL